MLILYGFAKVHGMQFVVIASELDKLLASVIGLWLSWRFFGYSRSSWGETPAHAGEVDGATRIVDIEPSGVTDYNGTYQEYVAWSGGRDRLNADQVIKAAKADKAKKKLLVR